MRCLMLYSVTLLKTKEALDNSRTAAEASYKNFETKMNFLSEWYVSASAFLPGFILEILLHHIMYRVNTILGCIGCMCVLCSIRCQLLLQM